MNPAALAVIGFSVAVGWTLCWWQLGRARTSFDEAFTGVYARLPLAEIPGALRADDTHPPLDYVLRHWFASLGDTWWLRAPSAMLGSLTLLVVARWMLRRGWFGAAVVALTAVSTQHVLYARDARPYALMILLGTIVAIASERWLERADRWSAVVVGVALLVGLFDHVSGLLLAGGCFLLPGLRRDAAAWWWRGAVAAPVTIWAAVWGPTLADQMGSGHAEWIPLTSFASLRDTVRGLASLYPSMAVLVVALLAGGGWLLWRSQRRLGQVWLCLFVAPLVAAALIGTKAPFLLPRTLAFAAWAVPVAFAAVVDRARTVSRPAGLAAVAASLVLLAPSARVAVNFEHDSGPARAVLAAQVAPGDAIAVHPPRLAAMMLWDHGLDGPHQPVPAALSTLDAFVLVPGAEPFSGIVWLQQPRGFIVDVTGLEPCGDLTPVGGDYELRCFRVATPEGVARQR